MKEAAGSFFDRFRRKRRREERQERELREKIKSQREEIEGMVSELFGNPKVVGLRTPSNYFPDWRDEMPNLHWHFLDLHDKNYISCAVVADYAEDSITVTLGFDYSNFEFGSEITVVMDEEGCTITEDAPDDLGNYTQRVYNEPAFELMRLRVLKEALVCFPKIKAAAGVEESERRRREYYD